MTSINNGYKSVNGGLDEDQQALLDQLGVENSVPQLSQDPISQATPEPVAPMSVETNPNYLKEFISKYASQPDAKQSSSSKSSVTQKGSFSPQGVHEAGTTIAPQAQEASLEELMRQAQEEDKQTRFIAGIMRAGEQLNQGMSGVQATHVGSKAMEEQGTAGQKRLDALLEKRDKDKKNKDEQGLRDPNSTISKQIKELYFTVTGMKPDPSMSAFSLGQQGVDTNKMIGYLQAEKLRRMQTDMLKTTREDKSIDSSYDLTDKIRKNYDPDLFAGRTAGAVEGRKINSVLHALNAAMPNGVDMSEESLNKLTAPQMTELAVGMATSLSPLGTPTREVIHDLKAQSTVGDLMKKASELFNLPKGMNQGKFAKLIIQQLLSQSQQSADIIAPIQTNVRKQAEDLLNKGRISKEQFENITSNDIYKKLEPYKELLHERAIRRGTQPTNQASGPAAGTIVHQAGKHYKFLGGDPKDGKNYQEIQ
jgi:hypothetical protein